MIQVFRKQVFFILLFIASLQLNGQFTPAPVEKANQKVLFEGKVYYIHTVKNGQTLYSISRAYGVTVQDIATANPNIVLEVISDGQTLKIPEVSQLDDITESYFGLTKDDFYYHTVKPHETIHFISKKYNVNEEDIYHYNPGSEDVIQIGEVLKIPKEHVLVNTPPIDENEGDVYKVKQGDTLYTLSKRFGIPIEELIRINPQLRWGLKTGMVLSLNSSMQNPLIAEMDSASHIEMPASFNFYSQKKCDSIKNNHPHKAIKAVFLAPFHAREILMLDTITNDSARRTNPAYKNLSKGLGATEFYEGLLLALDSLKKSGNDITLFTYDTKSDTNQIHSIIKELEIIRPDIIFGPFSTEEINIIAKWAYKNKTPIVLPTSNGENENLKSNPYVINLIPNSTTEFNACADYLSQFNDKNIILIHNEDSAGTARINDFKETLFAYFSSKSSYEEVLFKEIRVNDTSEKNLSHTLKENLDNVVFVISSDEAYVSNIIGLLRIQQSRGYSIQLFGLPVWQSFANLRIELLHQLNTVLYTPFYIDYTRPETKAFVKKCRSQLGYEPYKLINNGKGFNYTYLGYETGLLFLRYYANYGEDFRSCLCHQKDIMPENIYQFEWDNKQMGLYNVGINYKNFTTDFNITSLQFDTLKDLNNKPHEIDEIDVSPFLPNP